MHNHFANRIHAEPRRLLRWLALAWLVICPTAFAAQTNDPAAAADDTHTLDQRADKIVATLGLSDTNQTARVHGLIVQHYRDLSKIHEARDAAIKTARALPITTENKAATEQAMAEARAVTKTKCELVRETKPPATNEFQNPDGAIREYSAAGKGHP